MRSSRNQQNKYGKNVFFGAIGGIAVMTFVVFGLPHFLPLPSQGAHGEPVAEHIHVKIEGVTLPANIGINADLWKDHSLDKYGIIGYAPLHTHDDTNYIHIESTEAYDYTITDFLKIWGVQYKSIKLETVSEPNVFGEVHYYNISNPENYVLHDGDHLRLTLLDQ